MNILQKEELRYQFAGMAMQAILIGTSIDGGLAIVMATNDGRKGTAVSARAFADALIEELDRRDEP